MIFGLALILGLFLIMVALLDAMIHRGDAERTIRARELRADWHRS